VIRILKPARRPVRESDLCPKQVGSSLWLGLACICAKTKTKTKSSVHLFRQVAGFMNSVPSQPPSRYSWSAPFASIAMMRGSRRMRRQLFGRDTEASFARQGPAWLKHSAKYRVTIMQTAKPGIYVLQSLAQEPLTNLSGCSQLLGSERWMEVARIAFPELRNLQDAEDQP